MSLKVNLPTSALQTAIYARLNGLYAGQVFDYVPEGTDLPYIVVGDCTVVNYGTKSINVVDTNTVLHFYSEYSGQKDVQDRATAVIESVTQSWLSVSGWQVVSTDFDTFSINIESTGTGLRRHGTLTLRIKLAAS